MLGEEYEDNVVRKKITEEYNKGYNEYQDEKRAEEYG